MLAAWRELHRQRRQNAAVAELPVAGLAALFANVNRDPKRRSEPFKPSDFAFYQEREETAQTFTPEVAAVALDLRSEDRAPRMLLTVWPQILASSTSATPPEVRALRSDDDAVWVLAPAWEGNNCRGGLVLVQGRISGPVVVRDVDKPLITHCFEVPERPGFGWIEAGHLLVPAETSEHGRSHPAHRAGEPASR